MGVTGCNDNTEDESSIEESSGPNVQGDLRLSDEEIAAAEQSEAERVERIRRQAEEIKALNTEYSQRYKDFIDKLINGNYSINYRYTTNINADYVFDVVKNEDNFYYKMSVTDVDGTVDGYEYFEKNGIGYFYDDPKEICVVIKDTVKTVNDVIPIKSGVKFKEKTTENFKGNEYSCDVFDVITGAYTDDMQNLEEKVSGTMKVYYDKDDNVVGIYEEYPDSNYSQTMSVGKIKAADISVFTMKVGYTEMSVEKYLEKYGSTDSTVSNNEDEEQVEENE